MTDTMTLPALELAGPYETTPKWPGSSDRARRKRGAKERTLDTFEAMEARRAGRIIVDDIDYPNDEDETE